MKHWIVHFDVMTQVRGEEPVTHKRALLVMAEDSDTAEAIARPHATLFTFGPKTLAVEWRKTSTVSLPLDVTAGVQAPVTLSGRPASEADECHAANLCIDAAVLFLTGDRAWPDGAMVLRDQFRAIWREHARGVGVVDDTTDRAAMTSTTEKE